MATKSRLTKTEAKRLNDLRTARMAMCDAGKWTRTSYNICEAQRANEEETSRLVAKRDNKMWL